MAFLYIWQNSMGFVNMKKMAILKKKRDFSRVFNNGDTYVETHLVLHVLEHRVNRTRYGFTVSRKIGNAVQRNRIKRRLKEIVRRHSAKIKDGFDVVIVARKRSLNTSSFKLEKSLITVIKKADLLFDE